MTKTNRAIRVGAFCLLILVVAAAAHAEDVEKKWRLGLQLGQYNNRPTVGSNSQNILVITNEDDVGERFFVDPRNDSAALGQLSVRPAYRTMVTGSYAFNKFFVIELAGGYQKGSVGDVEVQAQLDGVEVPSDRVFLFRIFGVEAGTMTQVPLQATAICRFRPKASLNPYVGIGVGYVFVGFEPSEELNQISGNMDRSLGTQTQLYPYPGTLVTSEERRSLEGARIEAPDSPEWHVIGGLEYSINRKFAIYGDFRYQTASSSFSIGFNGTDSLGKSVPNRRAPMGSSWDQGVYGPVYIGSGGLLDLGRIVPKPGAPVDTNCATTPGDCRFVGTPDGRLDTGYYYAQGGSIRYNGSQLSVGMKYTF